MALTDQGDILLPYSAPAKAGQVLVSDATGIHDWVDAQIGRNAIINGGMLVSQRGTSFSNAAGYTLDRFYVNRNSGAAGLTVTQQATSGVDFDSPNYMRQQRDSGNTLTASVATFHALESKNSARFRGKHVTFSFEARVGADYSGGNLTVIMYTGTGTDQAVTSIQSWTGVNAAINTTQTITTTGTRYTFTTPSPLGTGVNQLGFLLQWTPTGTAGTNDYLDITNIQLEAGQVATPFDALQQDVGKVLAQCQRYLWRMESADADYIVAGGFAGSTITGLFTLDYPVTMRSEPTLSVSNVADFDLSDGNSNFNTTSIAMSSVANKKHSALITATTSGLTQFRPYALRFDGGGTRYMSFDAEL